MTSLRLHPMPLAGTLNLWMTLAMVVAAAGVMVLSWLVVEAHFREQLQARGELLSQRLSVALTEAVWNLDEQAIRDFFDQRLPMGEVQTVVVEDQFGGRLFERTLIASPPERGVIHARTEVFKNGEIIGGVAVEMATTMIAKVRRQALIWTALMATMGMGSVMVTTRLLLGFLLTRPLQELTASLRRLAAGELNLRLPPGGSAEISQIHAEVNVMAGQIADRTLQLENLRDHLEELVRIRTQALAMANRQLNAEVLRRQEAQRRLLTVGGGERRRIGRDLHDTLGQELTGIAFLGSAIENRLRQEKHAEAEAVRNVVALLHEALTQTRRIARGLTPAEMTGESFLHEMARLTEDAEVLYGIACRFECEGEPLQVVDGEAGTHLYRIAQEAINNGRRHGLADSIVLRLEVGDGQGVLRIIDNGRGLPPPECRGNGLGMTTMRDRAELIGGFFEIGPGPQGGTEVRVAFPNPPGVEAVGEQMPPVGEAGDEVV